MFVQPTDQKRADRSRFQFDSIDELQESDHNEIISRPSMRYNPVLAKEHTVRKKGVFGESVSVTEGDSVSLNSDLTEMMDDDLILWRFGDENTLIAQINVLEDSMTVYDDVLDGRFRDRLKLNHHTGSLTITHTTTEHTGVYRLYGATLSIKSFSVSVYAHLPTPNITKHSSSSSSSSCSVVCSSVLSVCDATLSWYAGMSVLSSISVCDLSISLSLPLEVEYQDKNTYSCVLNNPISNQTTHLDINTLCHTREGVFSESVSVMEGDTVTLNTDLTKIHEDDDILWKYGPKKSLIAKISIGNRIFTTYDDVPDGRFRDRLKLDDQTGSLIITHTTTEHTGVYKLEINGAKLTSKTFSVSVYVLSVCDATLSWYAGMSVLSSISVCDLSISLSLPLEVEYQDKNTYSCVLNNPISNQTTHLDINTLCRHTCAVQTQEKDKTDSASSKPTTQQQSADTKRTHFAYHATLCRRASLCDGTADNMSLITPQNDLPPAQHTLQDN
ncbi:hypothetical protein F2P79_013827 [Pimephales promelas]|nr:hypothetical protein F2P79_013827 [Pimephales promelas]